MTTSGDFRKLAQLSTSMQRLGVTARKDTLKVFANYFSNRTDDCFLSSHDPYGEKWLPLQNPKGRRVGGQPLIDTSRLKNSITRGTHQEGGALVVESNVVYAAIHNYGGSIEQAERTELRRYTDGGKRTRISLDSTRARSVRTTANVGAHTVSIPRRQFLPDKDRGLPAGYVRDLEASARAVLARFKKATR